VHLLFCDICTYFVVRGIGQMLSNVMHCKLILFWDKTLQTDMSLFRLFDLMQIFRVKIYDHFCHFKCVNDTEYIYIVHEMHNSSFEHSHHFSALYRSWLEIFGIYPHCSIPMDMLFLAQWTLLDDCTSTSGCLFGIFQVSGPLLLMAVQASPHMSEFSFLVHIKIQIKYNRINATDL